MSKLSLNRAAKEANVAKKTILEALNSGRMSAGKSDKGHWEIDPAELFRVFPKTGTDDHTKPNPTPQSETAFLQENNPLSLEVQFLKEQIARMEEMGERERHSLERQIEELRKERNDWKAHATALLTDQREKGNRGFWSRLK